jgi:CheY-like chemotaxis protein
MPVMNGFEATRAIREFETTNNLKPAIIIALTGLANGRDQAEGFSAGCDIYMTKPVSFKELSKLLKNWEGNMDAIQNPDEYTFITR